MSNKRKHIKDVEPARSAWAAAALSILSLCIISTVIVDYSEYARRNAALEELKKAADSVDYAKIESATKQSGETLGLGNVTSWVLNRHTDMSVPTMLSLVEASKQIEMNQFVHASQILGQVEQTLVKPYDSELADSEADKNDPIYVVHNLIRETTSLLFKNKTLTKEIEDLHNERKSIDEEFLNISREVLFFLSLPSTRTVNKIEFYKNGVLKGLPKLEKIPDDVTSLAEFAKLLEKVGGSVTTPEGLNAPTYFSDKLQEFQDKSFTLELRLQDLNSKITAKQAAYEQSQKDLMEKKTKMKSRLIWTVVDSCETQLVLNYKIARNLHNSLKLL